MLSACVGGACVRQWVRVGNVRHPAGYEYGHDRYTAGLSRNLKSSVPAASQPSDTQAEAARYVLFGRILPTLRHALVGELQALRFGVSIVRASTEPADVEAAINRLGEQTARSIASADAITCWLQPDPRASIAVDQAIDDCIALMHSEWQMRGIVVSRGSSADTSMVRSRPFRELLLACLVALGDDLPGAADIALRTRPRAGALWLTIRGEPADREGEEPRAAVPRRLRWEDVDALAGTHTIVFKRRGHRIAARFALEDRPRSQALGSA